MDDKIKNKEEIFDIVDENGNITGSATRKECHSNPSLRHRVVHIFVFSANGDLLLQKRSKNKDIQPDKWDTSVGGHVDHGEDVEKAAVRELSEELGITGSKLQFLYSFPWRSERESELVYSFKTIYDGKIDFSKEEISETRYFSMDEIKNRIGHKFFTQQFEYEWLNFPKGK